MAISLFAGALRYLGLSQEEAAEMLDASHQSVRNWATGRSAVPPGVWSELGAFARARDAEVARLRPYTRDDAAFVIDTLDGPPPGFPCSDAYVTTLAAAVLTSVIANDR